MVDRNSAGFITCYYKASELFKNLKEEMDKFKVFIIY